MTPLDFWLGSWVVHDTATGELAGRNEISEAIAGNAVLERWEGAGGLKGVSGDLRDRTTLTPLPDGTVRQVIDVAPLGSEDWETGFDAIYTRV